MPKSTKTPPTNFGKSTSTSKKGKSKSTSSKSTFKPKSPRRGNSTSVKINHNDVKVVSQNSNGSVVLSIETLIDENEAINSDVNTLEVSLSKRGEDPSKKSDKSAPDNVLKNILESSSNADLLNKKVENQSVIKQKTDITSKFNNTTAKNNIGKNSNEGFQQEIVNLSPDSLASSIENTPILQTPTFSGVNLTEDSKDTSELSLDSIFIGNLSPTKASDGLIPFSPAEDTLGGILSPIKKKLNDNVSPVDNIISSNIKGSLKDVFKASDIGKGSTPFPSLRRSKRKNVKIVSTITVSSKDLASIGNTGILKIAALDKKGNEVSSAACAVDIVEKINEADSLKSPFDRSKGKLQGLERIKSNTDDLDLNINLKSRLNRVNRDSSPSDTPTDLSPGGGGSGQPRTLERYSRVFSQFGPISDSTWKISEMLDNPTSTPKGSTTIERIIGQGFSPTTPDFDDLIVPSPSRNLSTANPILRNTVSETDNRFLSLSTFLRKGGIAIRLDNFQSSYTVVVVRKDTTLNEQKFTPISVPEPYQVVSNKSPAVTFVDTQTKLNHIYEYRAKIFTRRGREIFSTAYSLIKYEPLVQNAVDLIVSQPEVSINSRGILDVKFDINVKVPKNNISATTALLQSSNLSTFFETEIRNQKEKLEEITIVGIERIDLTRGVTEDFGFFTETSFSDFANRTFNNVSQLRSQTEYRYVISVYRRKIDEILPTTVREVVDSKTQKTYALQPAKWLHPSTLSRGVLRTKKTILAAQIDSEFKQGFTGVQKFVNVSTKTSLPKITTGTATKTSRGNVELKWIVKGDMKRIDHFVVMGTQLGMRSILGKAHALVNTNAVRFEDRVLSKCVCTTTYSVYPVYLDFSKGQEIIIGSEETDTQRIKRK